MVHKDASEVRENEKVKRYRKVMRDRKCDTFKRGGPHQSRRKRLIDKARESEYDVDMLEDEVIKEYYDG